MSDGSPDRGPGTAAHKTASPLWLLALITLSGTLAMHIFVPALQLAAHDFAAGATTTQLTLSAYIVGLSLGQLTYGPISDHLAADPS